MLRVNRATIDRERLAGRLRCTLIRRRVLFTIEAVRDYIASQQHGEGS